MPGVTSAPAYHNTPSLRTNELILFSLDVQEQRAELAEFHQEITLRFQEFEQEQAAFASLVETLEDDQQTACKAEIEAIYQGYTGYYESLNALRHCQVEILDVGAEQLSRAALVLVGTLELFQRKRLELAGPYRHHVVNLLLQQLLRFQLGDVGEIEYQDVLTQLDKRGSDLAQQVTPPDEVAALREASQAYLEALSPFKNPTSLADEEARNAAAEHLEQVLIGLDSVLSRLGYRRDSGEPSASNDLNVMISGLRRYLAGSLPLPALRRLVDPFTRAMMEAYGQVQALAQAKLESVRAKQSADRIAESWIVLDTFLGRVLACQHPDDAYFLLEEIDPVVRAANDFVRGFEVLRMMAEQSSKILCIHCDHGNPPDARTCQKCNAHLPRVVGTSMNAGYTLKEGAPAGALMPMTSELLKLAQAVNRVAEGRLSDEQFLDEVSLMEMFLSHHQEQVIMAIRRAEASVKRTPDEAQKRDALTILEKGQTHIVEAVGQILDALDMLREYPQRRSPSHLVDSMQMVWGGFQLLYDLHAKVSGKERDSVAADVDPLA